MNTNGDPHQKCIWSKRGNICDCILIAKRVSALYFSDAEFKVILNNSSFLLNKIKIIAIIKLASEKVIQNLLSVYIPAFRIEILRDCINTATTNAIKVKQKKAKNNLADDFSKISAFKTLGPIKIKAIKIIVPTTV